MTRKVFSAIAIQALKEALTQIYWYKSDLKSFLQMVISDQSIIGSINWENYKRQIAADVVDLLIKQQDATLPLLTKLCTEITQLKNFKHLEALEDGTKKARKAKEAVDRLREILNTHIDSKAEEIEIERRRKQAEDKLQRSKAVISKLEEIKTIYIRLFAEDPQKRGYELEKIFHEIFDLFDLDPRASFKIEGEQIDGAFCLDSFDYIFEAKWQKNLTPLSDLDVFASKLDRKLDNTLGLFLSITGFEQSAISKYSSGGSKMLLMDGADLMAILEGRIDLTALLLRKKSYASQTGIIFLPIHKILTE